MKKLFPFATLILAVVLFVAVNFAANIGLRSTGRWDLTENGLYTLSDGTQHILENLEEPITLRFYFSREVANEETRLAPLLTYAERVEELLEEYEAASSEITLEVIEPEPFSEEEDRAVGYGLTAAPVNAAGDQLYFGLVGTNSVDEEVTIPFFDSRRQHFLEYDLTELVHKLANLESKVCGVISTLPLQGEMMDPRRPPQRWIILQQIEQIFDLRFLDTTTTEIDEDIDLLMLVHPKGLSDETLFAIDQFALRGGRVLAFVDGFCDADPGAGGNPQQQMMAPKTSELDPLLHAWGLDLAKGKLAGDVQNAERVGWQNGAIDYVLWLRLRDDCLSESDFVTSGLDSLSLRTPGFLTRREDATTTVEPLIETSVEAMQIDTMQVQFQVDPERLLNSYFNGDERLMLAARISGPARSAFPDGKPKAAAADPEEDGAEAESDDTADFIADSDSIQVIVVADADLLHESTWARVQNFLGQSLIFPTASNGDFVVNCLENLGGSDDLISLRSRGSFQRPFDKKLELERAANDRYRAKEQELESKLRELERNLSELQQEKDGASALILSDDQREAIAGFREQQVETRKELREVRRELRNDIESLGSTLKLANILAVPALLLLGLLGMWAFKR